MKKSSASILKNLTTALILLGFSVPCNSAKAFEYEFEIPIQDEEDLNDAYTLGLIEDEETVNNLTNLLRNGLDINTARYNDLIQLPGVTVGMANAILQKRKELGKFGGMRDLQAIEEVGDEMWERLIPFLKLPEDGHLHEEIPVTANVRFGYLQNVGSGRESPLNEIPSTPGFYLKGETTVKIKRYKLSFGTLMTIRDMFKNSYYDKDAGYMVNAKGEATGYSFDGAYAMFEAPWVKVIGGSYNIGFGEKLTFDSTGKSNPNGITLPLHYYENNNNGNVRPEKSLLGLAAVFDNMRLSKGWMTASAWLSYKKEDLYQYDGWYGDVDEDGNFYECTRNSDCTSINPVMTCGKDNYCHSSKFYMPVTDSEGQVIDMVSQTYQTLYHYYTERLFGAQVAYNLNDRTRFGFLGYASQWLFDDMDGAKANFSLSASYPSRGSTYAFGIYGTVGVGPVDMGFEGTIQDNKGAGAIFRLEASPLKELDITYRMRFYNALYDNPYGRGFAAADELLGKRNRNEFGNRLTINYKPIKYFRMVTDFDIWSHPFTTVTLDDGQEHTIANEPWITDINLIQRFVIRPAPRNTITLWASYKNKDITTNGFSYLNDAGVEKGNAYSATVKQGDIYVEGRGEQVQASLQLQSNQYKPLNASIALINVWEGVTKYTDHFDYSLKLWLMISYKPWKFTNMSTKFKYWFHQTPYEYDAENYSDRGEPQFDWYFVINQQLPMGFALKAHYGITKYIDNRMTDGFYLRYDTYHTIKAFVEWNYDAMKTTKTFAQMKEQGTKKKKGKKGK